MSIVYLNGHYLPQEQATVSVMDRGFLFGDGIYEVVPIYSGKTFCLAEHLNRLQRSLNAVNIQVDISYQQWQEIFHILMEKNPSTAATRAIYLQITRGAGSNRSHHYRQNLEPTIFSYISEHKPPSSQQLMAGFSAITVPDIRWHNCYIKTINLLPNILSLQQARANNAEEAIFIRDGFVIEAASSNVFIVKKDKILTPPLSHYMLPGVTRDLIMELALKAALPCEAALISEEDLHTADEIWLTGSVKEIFPIKKLDGKIIGDGKAGNISKKIIAIYNEYKANFTASAVSLD